MWGFFPINLQWRQNGSCSKWNVLLAYVCQIVLLLSWRCSHYGCDFVDNFHFVILHKWSSASVDGI